MGNVMEKIMVKQPKEFNEAVDEKITSTASFENLLVITINIRGLTNQTKKEILSELCSYTACDVLCIQETHSDREGENGPNISGMNKAIERPHKKHGSAIFVRPGLKIISKSLTEENGIEILTIEMENYTVTSIYKPPKVPFAFKYPANFENNDKAKIIVGDFNSHGEMWGYGETNADGLSIEEWTVNHDLVGIHDPKVPYTLYKDNKGYNPDLIFVSKCLKKITSKRVCNWIKSPDHSPVFCEINKIEPDKIRIEDFERYRDNPKEFYKLCKKIIKSDFMGRIQYLEDKKANKIENRKNRSKIFEIDELSKYFEELNLQRKNENNDYDNDVPSISIVEVQTAIKKLKKNKVLGEDNYELCNLEEQEVSKLHEIIYKSWEKKELPDGWNEKCIYIFILLGKFEEEIGDYQSGFRKETTIINHIFEIRRLMENHFAYKKKELHLVFVNYKQAYGILNRTDLWDVLFEKFKSKTEIIRTIKLLYTKKYVTERGLRLKDAMTPVLFNLALESVVRNISKYESSETWLKNGRVLLAYADDIVIIEKTQEGIREYLTNLILEGKRLGLNVDTNKTKYLVMETQSKSNADLTINNFNLTIDIESIKYEFEQVRNVKYLGINFNDKNLTINEIDFRINAAQMCIAALDLLEDKKISDEQKKEKIEIYLEYIRPVLTYACPTWVFDNADVKLKLKNYEIKIFNRILYNNIKKTLTNSENIYNEVIEIQGISRILDVITFVDETRKNWYNNNVKTANENSLIGTINTESINGTKRTGTPRKKMYST